MRSSVNLYHSFFSLYFFYIENIFHSFIDVLKLVIDFTISYIFQATFIIFVRFILILIFDMLLPNMSDFFTYFIRK